MTTLPRTFALDTDRDTFETGRITSVLLFTVQITLAWYLAFAGMGKVAALSPDIAAAFNVAATGDGVRALVGALQIAGAITLLAPRRVVGIVLALVAWMPSGSPRRRGRVSQAACVSASGRCARLLRGAPGTR